VNGHIDEYIEFKKPLEIRYTASAGAITDIASQNIFLIAGATSGIDDTVTLVELPDSGSPDKSK